MNEAALDIRHLLRVLGRRWLVIAAVVIAGAGLGIGAAIVQTPTFLAKSAVLLPPSGVDSLGNPVRNVRTDVNIAGSAEVLARVVQSLRPAVSVTSLRHRVKVVALTPDILEIRAKAASGRDAATLADAVATGYVSYANDSTAQVATTTLTDLQAQASDLDQHIRTVNSEIADDTSRLAALNPQSPEGSRQSAIIDSLRQDLSDTARQLSTVDTKIADARLAADLTRRGTRLLQPALIPSRPATPRPLWYAVAGTVAGLILAVLAVLFWDRDRRQLRRREDIAEVAAAPVLLSLTVPRRDAVEGYRALLEQWEPSLAERWSTRQLLNHLGIEDQATNLAVVTMEGDTAGPALAVLVAKSAAFVGVSTALVIDTPHPGAATLRAAANMGLGKGALPYAGLAVLAPAADATNGPEPSPATQLIVTLVVASSGAAPIPNRGRRTVAVLGVSSGFATADELAAVAVRCFDAHHPLAAVVVANPDPSDRSTGRVTPPGAAPLDLAEAPERSSSTSAGGIPRPVA